MIQQDKKEMKVRRRHRHLGLKIVIAILVVLILAAGGLGFAYTRGFGYPSQQDVLLRVFSMPSPTAPMPTSTSHPA